MKALSLALSITILVTAISAMAADDVNIERLATCEDSWLEWKNQPSKLEGLSQQIRSGFAAKRDSAFLVPKSEKTVFGLKIVQLFPETIGMAVGFSVMVEEDFKKTRATLEKRLEKPFKKCETGDNMHTCSLEIGEKRTILLMAEENEKAVETLIGCYYYYEK